jgi:hypothetical protein
MGGGLGTLGGMAKGTKDFVDNYEKACGPNTNK